MFEDIELSEDNRELLMFYFATFACLDTLQKHATEARCYRDLTSYFISCEGWTIEIFNDAEDFDFILSMRDPNGDFVKIPDGIISDLVEFMTKEELKYFKDRCDQIRT